MSARSSLRRASTHVVRRGPVASEVPPVNEQIGRGDDASIRRRHHGRVVTGTEHVRVAGTQPRGDARDQAELPEPADTFTTRNVAPPPTSASVSSSRASRQARGGTVVVQAYILIQTEVGKAASVAREIATLKA